MNDNVPRDFEPSYNLIEYEEGSSLTIGFNCIHGLSPFSKVVNDHDNVLMPPSRSCVEIHKVHPPLVEGTEDND